jgi:hypothetical protein
MPNNTTNNRFGYQLPVVGGDANDWGGYLNANWQLTENLLTASAEIAPDLGTVGGVGWKIGGTIITTSGDEINLLTGLNSTAAELDKLHYAYQNPDDSNVLTDDDGVFVFDLSASELKWVGTVPLYNYINGKGITTVGALESGSITSDFGNIDIGDSTITTTGAVTFGSLTDSAETPITVTGFVDEDDMASDSVELVPTQQSVKAYVDTSVAAQTGEVLQVVTGVTSTVASYPNSGVWSSTAITVSFAPKALGSTFLVEVFSHFGVNGYGGLALKSQVDNETAVEITGSNGTGNRTSALAHVSDAAGQYGPQAVSFAYTDDSIVYDADSETITYTVLARPSSHSSSYEMWLNRGEDSTDRDLTHYIASSTIKVTEIAG